MSTVGALEKRAQAAEREQRRAEERRRELVERHAKQLASYERHYRERTAGVRESLDVAQRQAAEGQARIAQLEGDLEQEQAAHAALRERLRPKAPERLVVVRWTRDHQGASISDRVYMGKEGQLAQLPADHARVLGEAGYAVVVSTEKLPELPGQGLPWPTDVEGMRDLAASLWMRAEALERGQLPAATEQAEQQTERVEVGSAASG